MGATITQDGSKTEPTRSSVQIKPDGISASYRERSFIIDTPLYPGNESPVKAVGFTG